MDLMDLKPKSDVVEIFLKHPNTGDTLLNEDGSEMTITVAAQHSSEYRNAMYEQQDRRIKAMQKKGSSSSYSAADIERDTLTLLAKITKSWDLTYGAEKPKLTEAKAKEVYTDIFWIRSQIEEALAESADFTKD